MATDLATRPSPGTKLRRCFITAQSPEDSAALARTLDARGVKCFRADDIAAGSQVTVEILRHLQAADFVCAALADADAAPNIAFELGVAHILRKPIVLVTRRYDRAFGQLHGIYVIKADIEDPVVSAEIDRFLRHAGPLPPLHEVAAGPGQKPNLSWAREALAELRRDRPADAGWRFERLVAEMFRRAGGEVVHEAAAAGPAARGDLLVWLDDLAYETGGPMIVECKLLAGGSGSVLANSKRAIEQIEKYLQASDAKVALLVFDHDRPVVLPRSLDTPRVLAFPIDRLLESLERGSLAEEILEQRRRASQARVSAGGAD